MIVKCDWCGRETKKKNVKAHNFCCNKHRLLWNKANIDFSKLSLGHKAKHLTILNQETNHLASNSKRGNSNSHKSRKIMSEYLNRKLLKNEEVHHINGNAEDNRVENMVVLTKSKHRRMHRKIALLKYKLKGGDANAYSKK